MIALDPEVTARYLLICFGVFYLPITLIIAAIIYNTGWI